MSEVAQEHCLVGVRLEPGAQLLLLELQSPSLQDNGNGLRAPRTGTMGSGKRLEVVPWARRSAGMPVSPHCGEVGEVRVARGSLWRGSVQWERWEVTNMPGQLGQGVLAFTSPGGGGARLHGE